MQRVRKVVNGVPIGNFWNKTLRVGPTPRRRLRSVPGCRNLLFERAVPALREPRVREGVPDRGVSCRRDGTIQIDKDKCIGCQFCAMACPYGVRYLNQTERVVEKCTLCNHLTAAGEKPACVKNCCGTARYYGDLDDPESDVSKVLAAADPDSIHQLPDVGNHPLTSYILSPRFGEWRADDLTQQTSKYVTIEGSVD